MKGMISEGDIDGDIEALQAEYPAVGVHMHGGGERGGFSMLVDWQDLKGWERGAKTLGTVTTRTVGDAVRKIAIAPLRTRWRSRWGCRSSTTRWPTITFVPTSSTKAQSKVKEESRYTFIDQIKVRLVDSMY